MSTLFTRKASNMAHLALFLLMFTIASTVQASAHSPIDHKIEKIIKDNELPDILEYYQHGFLNHEKCNSKFSYFKSRFGWTRTTSATPQDAKYWYTVLSIQDYKRLVQTKTSPKNIILTSNPDRLKLSTTNPYIVLELNTSKLEEVSLYENFTLKLKCQLDNLTYSLNSTAECIKAREQLDSWLKSQHITHKPTSVKLSQ